MQESWSVKAHGITLLFSRLVGNHQTNKQFEKVKALATKEPKFDKVLAIYGEGYLPIYGQISRSRNERDIN
jgi:hypothetical protein